MIKRLFDLVFAFLGLLISIPLLAVLAVAIKATSRGPVFFRQVRIGRFGRPFTLFKLRTMTVDAAAKGPGISQRRDPRETYVGRILRKTKLDELPQLVNILKGEMSVVGPRPEIPKMVALYTDEQRKALEVRPGLVGPAQIIGRNEADMIPESLEDVESYYANYLLPEKLKIDVAYAAHPRLIQDLQLIWRGIWSSLRGLLLPFYQPKKASWPMLFIIDMILVTGCYYLAYILRFDSKIPETEMYNFTRSLPVVLLVRAAFFIYFRLYRSQCKYIGWTDLFHMMKVCVFSTVAIVLIIFFIDLRVLSRSVFIIDGILMVGAMAGARIFLRIQNEKEPAKDYSLPKRVLVIGAGDVGDQLIRQQNRNGHAYQVVGFIDDNPEKLGTTLHGIKVYGNRKDIPDIARQLRVDEILIAITNITSEELRNVLSFCEKTKLKHRVVPAISDVASGRIHLSKVRDVEVSDLLGRRMLSLDLGAIKRFLKGKRVLITGAGGSIGSELARQVAAQQPQSLVLLDRSENYLFELQCELNSHTCERTSYILGDVTCLEKMENVFSTHRPEIVFHTAAQKHVPLSEDNPDEAVRNNIMGSRIIARCADRFSVDHFVFVSTDKAVNPVNVMGATKRVVELFFQAFAPYSHTRFVTVRFGNVLNSHGSVVPLFMKQIQNGGPVTITDKQIERFFMCIPEAVNLILQAITMGESGEIYVLNMGQRVKIEKLAAAMIRCAGFRPYTEIAIKEIGLRPGEKLFEELVGAGETCLPTSHKMINRIIPKEIHALPELTPRIDELIRLCKSGDGMALRSALAALVPEYEILTSAQLADKAEK